MQKILKLFFICSFIFFISFLFSRPANAGGGPGYFSDITSGPDGNLWFTENNKIGKITPSGVITKFSVTNESFPTGITSGLDGNLWFVEANNIGRITTSGGITEFPLPLAGDFPTDIASGFDGNL